MAPAGIRRVRALCKSTYFVLLLVSRRRRVADRGAWIARRFSCFNERTEPSDPCRLSYSSPHSQPLVGRASRPTFERLSPAGAEQAARAL